MAKTLIGNVRGKDGRGISKIEKTATDGTIDTYTITYTDGTTSTYTLTNSDEILLQRQIASSAYIETGNKATRTYNAGDYIVANGVLKKATTAISSGSTFSSANSQDTTIVNELKSGTGGSAGGKSYSTRESDTGEKWVDGKAIYSKTIVYEGDGTTKNKTVNLETGLAINAIDLMWIDAQNSFIDLTTRGHASGFMMPNHNSSWFAVNTMITINDSNYAVTVSSNENTPIGYCAITIRYIKK